MTAGSRASSISGASTSSACSVVDGPVTVASTPAIPRGTCTGELRGRAGNARIPTRATDHTPCRPAAGSRRSPSAAAPAINTREDAWTPSHRTSSPFAFSISRVMRARSVSDKLSDIWTNAAAASSVEPSKNVRTSCCSAAWRAVTRRTVGRFNASVANSLSKPRTTTRGRETCTRVSASKTSLLAIQRPPVFWRRSSPRAR